MPRIKKTATEIKQEQLMRNYLKKKNKGKKKVKAKNNPLKQAIHANYLKMPYNEYLQTPYWNTVREAVLKRDRHACVICKSKTNLQIHHDTYKHRGMELEHLSDLMTLCRECHKQHHYAQE